MENFPERYRDKQESLHLDTLNKIKEVLNTRTTPKNSNIFIHTTDETNAM